jgi:hypothetical protein
MYLESRQESAQIKDKGTHFAFAMRTEGMFNIFFDRGTMGDKTRYTRERNS